jgi:hypothetical protein
MWVICNSLTNVSNRKKRLVCSEILPYPQNTNMVSPGNFLSLSGVETAPIGLRIVVVGYGMCVGVWGMGVAAVVDECG